MQYNDSSSRKENSESEDLTWEPEVILDEDQFTGEQVRLIRNMLREECQAYSKDDVGCTKELQLEIKLTDPTPVQKNYNSVPPPLYREVKIIL